jgi:hypothetical protein
MTEVLTRVFFASSTLLGAVAAVYVIVHVIDKGFSVLSELWTRNKSIMLETYVFDNSYYAEVNKQYPHLTNEQVNAAFEQLRLYFEMNLAYSENVIPMPSKLVDTCWHVFICDTREYQKFCKTHFGEFLHHEKQANTRFNIHVDAMPLNPDSELSEEEKAIQKAEFLNLVRAAQVFQWALAIEGWNQGSIDSQVPQLFSMDEEYEIADGYMYHRDFTIALAKFDLEAASEKLKKEETLGADGSGAACGDGSAACGGCGGSV